ncbi:FMN-binding glutamate synthase family protein [Aliiglaciecola sp. CAU 1673]|uniref:FMN-binding glutamate synthase family protein n=1 Tax=Aliiglaciecola sp. CAU 1673 TaxID=3032595 RepID=UPI0023DA09AA|nr:FMN-binding glutamate synthase family protein [Aliiglaciecola sp. CAU 1673]MDF2180249.1 FMN-binding glutamate synthase family protein [Aliiglaciecola sp. CAU 1673]
MALPFFVLHLLLALFVLLLAQAWPGFIWLMLVLAFTFAIGLYDLVQTRHSIRRNFPLIGRMRWLMESLRPFARQYFVESDIDGTPISRMFRSIVYQRAKGVQDSLPYGTRMDTNQNGYEWIGHSIAALHIKDLNTDPKVSIGGPDCTQPYQASILNISAMSFGALSGNAITALNKGAKIGGFYHNTGEGGLSDYHLSHGADLVWQIGTAYFGCRDAQGQFSPDTFKRKAQLEQVKMIELKLSQGAKPGHGGILPAEKNSEEIARIRLVTPHTEVISPSAHSTFHSPIGLLRFIKQLRELAGGKPVGFKLCIGRRSEFIAICKAMVQSGIKPDFITVDGGEGGTGAAPLEYSNSVGMPLRDAIAFVDDCLVGFDLRDDIRVIASGKVLSAFHLVKYLGLGADLCNSARGMMLALGCVHSLICNTNRCPTGITTQDPRLTRGLDVTDKGQRVARFHLQTVRAAVDTSSSSGLSTPGEITRTHLFRRVNQERVMRFDKLYPYPAPGAFMQDEPPETYRHDIEEARTDSFLPVSYVCHECP